VGTTEEKVVLEVDGKESSRSNDRRASCDEGIFRVQPSDSFGSAAERTQEKTTIQESRNRPATDLQSNRSAANHSAQKED